MNFQKRQPVVHFPSQFERDLHLGDIFGYYHEDTNEYNIILPNDCADHQFYQRLTQIVKEKPSNLPEGELIAYWEDGQINFQQGQIYCQKKPYDLLLNIFSRNSGILETDVMLNKSAIIVGLGSVGSLVSLELARAGVGNFLLVDNDTLAYHNICRHQLGIKDIGKFKVNAVREQILQINPLAIVQTSVGILEDIDKLSFDEFITKDTIIIGCADNREGDLYANHISKIYKIPFVSIGFWERAFAGEIFYSIPGRTPCYSCLFGKENNLIMNRPSVNRRFYTNEENLSGTRFEPGISTDINFVTIIGIKLILDLMNLENKNYIPRLLNTLSQFTLVCNTNDSRIGGMQAEIFSYPLQITTSIKVEFDDKCQVCKINN